MKNLTLNNIAIACEGVLHCSDHEKNIEVQGAVLDSRLVEKDFLFFATRGEKVDGHSFIPQVYEKGAACVICETEPDFDNNPEIKNKPYILVKDSFIALKKIAMFYRQQLDIPFIGITGSVGKTSTKEAIAAVLSVKYNVLKTKGNFNNEIGLPLTVLSVRDEHEVAVVEMGISDFGEMNRLSEIARPDICVITNIGLCHLENLKSQEGILKAKTEIFNYRNKNGAIILNGDDPFLNTIEDVEGTKPLRFGYSDCCDMKITDIKTLGLLGSDFTLKLKNGDSLICHSSLPGNHVIANSACAALVALSLSLSEGEIKRGITVQKAVTGRSNLIDMDKYLVIDDCYNANPVSMKEAIDLLTMAEGRKVAILGDMFELGDNEKALHSEIGAYAVEKGVDILLTAGELAKNIHEAAKNNNNSAGMLIKHFESRESLIENLFEIIKKGDSCLVKASHGMHYELVVEALCSSRSEMI